jgi:hypothetical protein
MKALSRENGEKASILILDDCDRSTRLCLLCDYTLVL